MTTYLEHDAVDDNIYVPNQITIDKVVYDIVIHSGDSDFSGRFIDTDISSFQVRGTSFAFTPSGATGVVMDQRTVLSFPVTTYTGSDISLFSYGYAQAGYYSISADIYDIKLYNAGTLVAHYDMSTGTVKDQSGNGNDATLVGGTWMGASTGTPGSSAFDTKQSIYRSANTVYSTQQSIYRQSSMSADLKQAIYESLSQSFDTRQQLYRSSTAQYDTEQMIYRTASRLFDTLQQITNNGIQGSTRFDTRMVMYSEGSRSLDTQQALYERITSRYDLKQAIYRASEAAGDVSIIIYADGLQQADTRQTIYQTGSAEFDTMQKLFDPDHSLIGTIELEGQRNLHVYLVGKRELNVNLKGVI